MLKAVEQNRFNDRFKADISASFQKTAIGHIVMKLKKYSEQKPPSNFAIVGGASANSYLRGEIKSLLNRYDAKLYLVPLQYCSDNAVMIGRVGIRQYHNQDFSDIDMDISTKSVGL